MKQIIICTDERKAVSLGAMSAAEHRVYFLLQIAAHRLRNEADRALLDTASVTTAQAAVLQLVASIAEPTQRKLADMLQQNESAMTAMVGRLTTAGLIVRAPHPTDGRAWILELTPRGEAAIEAGRPAFDAINTALDTAIGGPKTAGFARTLRAITDTLDARQPDDGETNQG